MINEVITEGLPKGWMIVAAMIPAGPDFETSYVAYRWKTVTTKRLFRKPLIENKWVDAGFRSRWSDTTRAWIIGTSASAEVEKNTEKGDLFDVTAKGHGHVSILLNGKAMSSTKVYGSPDEAVAHATLRWGATDQLTYDNAHYVSVTRRKES